jgi:hypothetical protein
MQFFLLDDATPKKTPNKSKNDSSSSSSITRDGDGDRPRTPRISSSILRDLEGTTSREDSGEFVEDAEFGESRQKKEGKSKKKGEITSKYKSVAPGKSPVQPLALESPRKHKASDGYLTPRRPTTALAPLDSTRMGTASGSRARDRIATARKFAF